MRLGLKARGQVRGKVFVARHNGASKIVAHRCEKREETRERRNGKRQARNI